MSAIFFLQNQLSALVNSNSVDSDTFNNTVAGMNVGAFVFLQILNIAIFAYAIYLSFKRNKGFNLGSFLGACCCSICYIVYAWAVPV